MQADSQIEKTNFGQLVRWIKLVPEPVPDRYFADLRSAIADWRKRRNRVVHGMVKSVPGSAHGDVFDFLEESKLGGHARLKH
jgi:hypothetical protein